MKELVVFVIGVFVGGALSFLYAAWVISKYKKAVAAAGMEVKKIQGKLVAIKKVL